MNRMLSRNKLSLKNSLCLLSLPILSALSFSAFAELGNKQVSDKVIAEQRALLDKNTKELGFGPQSPRDIDNFSGKNSRIFNQAPHYSEMNLCNIHFHKNAEHKGGEFTRYAGNGNGKGYGTGYVYDRSLSKKESRRLDNDVCVGEKGGLNAGDTIELHYVHSSAQVDPGPTLGACLSDAIMNPQLRVETQVFVLVNDKQASDFNELTKVAKVNGYQQALNIPKDTGYAVQYHGSTTGPSYNQAGSPLQVSWSVRPKVKKVHVESVGKWCEANIFDESEAHGVRNLVINDALLAPIQ